MLTGMLPQENFLNLTLWDGFWGYFGAQNITTNFCFSPGMVTAFWFTSRLHAWRRVTISGFQASWERHEGATQARKPVRLLLIPCNTGRECVATALKICSFSGLISSLLRLDLDIRAGRLLACKQRVATLSQSKHCSGDSGSASSPWSSADWISGKDRRLVQHSWVGRSALNVCNF